MTFGSMPAITGSTGLKSGGGTPVGAGTPPIGPQVCANGIFGGNTGGGCITNGGGGPIGPKPGNGGGWCGACGGGICATFGAITSIGGLSSADIGPAGSDIGKGGPGGRNWGGMPNGRLGRTWLPGPGILIPSLTATIFVFHIKNTSHLVKTITSEINNHRFKLTLICIRRTLARVGRRLLELWRAGPWAWA